MLFDKSICAHTHKRGTLTIPSGKPSLRHLRVFSRALESLFRVYAELHAGTRACSQHFHSEGRSTGNSHFPCTNTCYNLKCAFKATWVVGRVGTHTCKCTNTRRCDYVPFQTCLLHILTNACQHAYSPLIYQAKISPYLFRICKSF